MRALLSVILSVLMLTPAMGVEYLKQSTAATLKLGPFLDSTDGNTVEPSLTISQADVRLSKNGGNIAQKNESTSATYDEIGFYDVPIDATDTNTLGRLLVAVHESGALPVWQEYTVLSATDFDRQVNGYEYTPTGGRIWFVESSGNDSNAGTRGLPKLTVQGAVTAASEGDLIRIGEGTFSGQTIVPVEKTNLTFQGEGYTSVLVYATDHATYAYDPVILLSDGCKMFDLRVVSTGDGVGVSNLDLDSDHVDYTPTNYVTIERCDIDGEWDGLYIPNCDHILVRDCDIVGQYDGLNCSGSNGLIDNCRIKTTANYSGGTQARAIIWGQSNTGASLEVRNSQLIAERTNTHTGSTSAIETGDIFGTYPQCLKIVNSFLKATSTNASATGEVAGIRHITGGTTNLLNVIVEGGSITTSTAAGAATINDIRIDSNASNRAVLLGTKADSAKFTGTVIEVDQDVAATLVDTADMQPKLGTPAGASVSADIAAAKAVIDTTNTRVTLALPAAAPDAAGGLPISDAGGLDMDQMASDASSAGGAGTVTADRVAKSSTFYVGTEGNTSRNIVTLNTWSSGTRTLGYDLKEYLQQSDTALNSVSSVTVINNATEASITTSNLRKHQNGYVAMWDTAAINTAGTYTVTVTVTTQDSNTVVVTGTLEVE